MPDDSLPPRFAPAEPPRLAIAGDGTLAAIAESSRVAVVELPGGAIVSEIGIARDASIEMAWVGAPPRLLLVSRHAAHTTVHLLEAREPRALAELRLEGPMRLLAAVGSHALITGAQGAAVISAGDARIVPYTFPGRALPIVAGAAAGQFLVAVSGAVEEWDPQARVPKRRLRLPRPAAITAIGGSERAVWLTTQQAPARIDVIPLINRGQPKLHDLPEPIAHASGHPRSDALVCIGAQSRRVYIVDLEGRRDLRTLALDGIDRVDAVALVVGRTVTVLGAQAGRPLALVRLEEGPTIDAAAPPVDPPAQRGEPARSAPSTLGDPDIAIVPRPAVPAVDPTRRTGRHLASVPLASAPSSSAPLGFTPIAAAAPPARAAAVGAPAASAPPPASDPARWRDSVVAWARAVFAGIERDAPAIAAVDALVARFDLAPSLRRALSLLYGAHLCGEPGVAPVDLARIDDQRWDEALGRGQLAAAGLAIYERSRVRLAAPIQRALDELPPTTGTLVGAPAPVTLLAPWAVVAPGEPLADIARRIQPDVGCALLAAHAGAALAELYLEARAISAIALSRVTDVPAGEPAIIVVDDEAAAEHLGLPIL